MHKHIGRGKAQQAVALSRTRGPMYPHFSTHASGCMNIDNVHDA